MLRQLQLQSSRMSISDDRSTAVYLLLSHYIPKMEKLGNFNNILSGMGHYQNEPATLYQMKPTETYRVRLHGTDGN